jgi:hypothetical protein
MQTVDKYVMDWCGGDTGNRYTDNVRGTEDDRRIRTESCELPGQFNFIIAQAAMARLTKDSDKEYAQTCEQAALRCQAWCDPKSPRQMTSIASGVRASIAMRRFDEAKAVERTRTYMKLLLSLQVKGDRRAESGFFRGHLDQRDPAREVMHGNLAMLALCDAIDAYPRDPDADTWREALQTHVDWLNSFSARSAYGTIPYALYVGADPGGNRRLGDYWYRWFMKPHGEGKPADWWVGVNAHLASHGVGLLRASRILKNPSLAALAQRQLDWIVGANPFDASTVSGVGRNQPALFVTREFRPTTPVIPGGVMCGIGGRKDDTPELAAGSYHTCEYWTPMIAYTALLLMELQISGRS